MFDLVRKFYSEIDPLRRPLDETWDSETVLALFEPMQKSRFLDIGCYDGSKTVRIARQIGAQDVYGVDFLSERLDQAHSKGVHVENVDLNSERKLPFPDSHFDVIFIGDVIEHIFSPDFLLLEIKRVLCPGGYVIITTPNLASWRNRIALLLGWQPFSTEVSTCYRVGNPRSPNGYPSGHIRIFTPSALRELVEIYEMQVEYVGGLINRGPRSGMTVVTGLIDDIIVRIVPALCDGQIVKVRKPLR